MAYYSCNYRIPVTIPEGEYNIKLNGATVFSGNVKSMNGSDVTIDISPVCRQELYVDYTPLMEYVLAGSSGRIEMTSCYGDFEVEGSEQQQEFGVWYNYNTDFESELDSAFSLSDPICRRVVVGQSVFYSRATNDTTGRKCFTSQNYIVNSQNISYINYETGIQHTLTDQCLNYALYYVNKYGGIDSLVCGKCTESWDGSNTDAELYSLRSSMLDTERVRIKSDITHSYNITTLPLTDAEASLIDNLIFSPQVFLHDIEANTIRAVIIDTSSVTRKYSRYDKAPYYSLTVRESQYQHRQ